MKKMLNTGLIFGLLALATLVVRADTDIYISDNAGKLGVVDLDTHAVTVIGTTPQVLHDIAFTSDGTLYGITSTALYSINQVTASTTFLGSTGSLGKGLMVGLVGDGSNLIAASYATNGLYAIDTAPFSATTLSGSLGGASNGDITFGADGALYDILTNGNLDKVVLTGSTYTSVVIGNTGNKAITGMATGSNGVTYAISGTEIYAVDLATGALSAVFNYAGHGLGVDTGAATKLGLVVPEPGTYALLIAGGIVLAFYQKRTRATARV